MPQMQSIPQHTEKQAKDQAKDLLNAARTAALAFARAEDGAPFISRIGLGLAPDGTPLSLISELAIHTLALRQNPRAALLVGEPGPRGDPLNSPRLSLSVDAAFVPADAPERRMLRDQWLAQHPKSKLYIDFADFSFVRFRILDAALNGGFGRAARLSAEDLA